MRNFIKFFLLQKFGDPLSIAKTSELIINNEYINGTVIEVDGGLVI